MDQFLLLGDSLTQGSFDQSRGFALGAALTDAYVRRLDVVNRGYSGYNTQQALRIIDKVIPPPSKANLRLLTIWFGANDARLLDVPGTRQHVPLDEFITNMRNIIAHPVIQAHKDVRIIILTTPPVEETLQQNLDQAKFPGFTGLCRTSEANAAYAKATRELADELNVSCLDVWKLLISKAGYDEAAGEENLPGKATMGVNKVLADFLHDGLHFNPAGYRVVYDALMELISQTWPDQRPDKLSYVLPAWDHSTAWSS